MGKGFMYAGIALLALVSGVVVYDYIRVNDADYKKNLRLKRKQKKIQQETIKKELEREAAAEAAKAKTASQTATKSTAIDKEGMDAKTKYNVEQSERAQQCLEKGDVQQAIQHYANVVKVQPNPEEFLRHLQQYLPPQLIARIAAQAFPDTYFETFPDKSLGFKVDTVQHATGGLRKCIATKAFTKDQEIMTCEPYASYLYPDLDVKLYCFTCKTKLNPETQISCAKKCIFSFCSQSCIEKGSKLHETFCVKAEDKDHPMFELMELSKESGRGIFFAVAEMLTLIINCVTDQGRVKLMDDLSHLYLPEPIPRSSELTEKEFKIMMKWVKMLSTANILDEIGYIALLCKTMYNAVEFQTSKNGEENRGTGKAIYLNAAYFNHNCNPNVVSNSRDYTNKVVFTANRDIAIGDELTVSYVNTGISLEERGKVLKSVYDFNCVCSKCKSEVSNVNSKKDEKEN